MPNWTPGPWKIYAEVNILGGVDGRRGVANCGGYSDGRLPDSGDAENKANAVLVAAAPALVEALEALLTPFEGLPEEYLEIHASEAVMTARAALRLARGE
jgi:hypothetical protein